MNLTASMGTTIASTKRSGRKPTEPKASKKPSKAPRKAKAPAKARKAATPRVRKPKATPAQPLVSLPKPAPAKPVAAKPAPAVRAAKAPGKYTIEKNRPSANGVTRPSTSTKCGAVWGFLDTLACGKPESVKLATVKEAAPGQGFNSNNAVIEFYRWRKFNGLRGRM